MRNRPVWPLGRSSHAHHPLAVAALLATLSGAVQAQGTAAEPQRIVVTASGFQQDLKQAPASISVITREELQTKSFRDLAEALQDVEGIDVRGATGKTGGLNISIRGMPSEYTLVLIDGRRQNTAGDVTPNGFGDALTSLMPPLSAIERIEVIRGPMSTLYGSDALGGVINIITRKVSDVWGLSASLEAGVPENSDAGDTYRAGFHLQGPLKPGLLGLSVRGGFFDRGETLFQPSSGAGTISTRGPSPVETTQHTLGARLTLTPASGHEVWLDVDAARTRYDNDRCQLGTRDYLNCTTFAPNTTASGYADEMRFNRDEVALGYTGRLDIGRVDLGLMHNVIETEGRTIPSVARPARDPSIGTPRTLETTNTVFDAKLVRSLSDNHVLTVGGQWWDAELVDGLVPSPYQQRSWALFAEDEWHLRRDLALTLGLRHDQHDAFGSHLSPRAYLVWNPRADLTVKGGISRGFRAPRLNQLTDGVSGISGQGTVISIGNPALKPEISTNTELGLLYGQPRGLNGSVTLFHNRVKDRIAGSGGDCSATAIPTCTLNPTATYPVNRDEATTWGAEFSGRVPLAAAWSLNLNYTWTDSEVIEQGNYAGKLGDTAKHVANAALRWDDGGTWAAWLRAEYRGKSRRFDGDPAALTGNSLAEYEALGDLSGYGLLHLGGQWRVSSRIKITASVNNLLDKDFLQFRSWTNNAGQTVWASPYFKSTQSTKGTVPAGRSLWLSASVDF